MAISTYAELKSAAATWLKRSDLTLRIPEFISLAEARLNRVLRARRAETEAALTAVASSRYIALPSTFGEALAVWKVIDGKRIALDPLNPALFDAQPDAGEPNFYAIDGANLAFERPADQAYSIVLRHLAKFALSDASPTNALLTDYPDVYLNATLCAAAPFLRDADLRATYEAMLTDAIRETNNKDMRGRASQPLRTDIAAMNQHRGGYDITRDV